MLFINCSHSKKNIADDNMIYHVYAVSLWSTTYEALSEDGLHGDNGLQKYVIAKGDTFFTDCNKLFALDGLIPTTENFDENYRVICYKINRNDTLDYFKMSSEQKIIFKNKKGVYQIPSELIFPINDKQKYFIFDHVRRLRIEQTNKGHK